MKVKMIEIMKIQQAKSEVNAILNVEERHHTRVRQCFGNLHLGLLALGA